MTKLLAVVPSDGLVTNPQRAVNFKFMFDAGLDYNVHPGLYSNPYGFIMRGPKDDDHVSPFKLARGEQGAIGDDGVAMWYVALGTSSGAVFNGHIEVTGKLGDLIKDIPDGTVLVPPDDIDDVRAACEELGIELIVHNHDGSLALSG